MDLLETLKTCNEATLYCVIDGFGGMIWRLNHDMADGRIPGESHAGIDKEIMDMRKKSEAATLQLPRFGVEGAIVDGKPTENYWKWFRWWDQWKHGLSDEEWREFDAAVVKGLTPEEEEKFRPEGKWEDHDGKYH